MEEACTGGRAKDGSASSQASCAPLHAPFIAAATARELVTPNTTPNPRHICHGIGIINWWSICSARQDGHGVLLLEEAEAPLQYYSSCSTLGDTNSARWPVLQGPVVLAFFSCTAAERPNGDSLATDQPGKRSTPHASLSVIPQAFAIYLNAV
jgi:hypothetical protein